MNKTIYDIGANNGDDTAYYLAKGFDVVAVEADPKLCDALNTRFAEEVAQGRLEILNVGVSYSQGTMPFYVNAFSEWSSFQKDSKATEDGNFQVIEVPTDRLSTIIGQNTAPYYVKIDIEGAEKPAIASLSELDRQSPFLSFEISQDWQANLTALMAVGYTKFQVVRQGGEFLPPCPVPALEGECITTRFTNQMSGPFGRDLPQDGWLSARHIETYVEGILVQRQRNRDKGLRPGWHDIHCRL